MKNLVITGLMVLMFSGVSCKGQTENKKEIPVASAKDIEVYYFHNTIRCVTCKTVEAEARKDIEFLYADKVKEGRISFIALNLEEATGKATGERLGVSGQTLLIVSGDKQINITNEGFLYAVSKPDKFREIIKEKVDSLLD